jgi:septum site-determining protein MinD
MKIVTAHSFRGGTGKTNIIANLSYILAKSGKKVGVVDADSTHPSLHIMFGLGNNPPSPTFADFLLNQCSVQDIIFDISEICALKDSLYLIPSKLDDATIYKIIQINQTTYHIQNH